MASDVDICNLSLSHLGDDATVSSIDPPEGSAQAEHCAKFYPVARNALLEMHDWRFAGKRVVLANVDNPLGSWQFAYALPPDCIAPRAVLLPQTTDDNDTHDFIVETADNGDLVLYTNVGQATLRYTALATNTTKFTPLFVAALARLLASYLAGLVVKGDAGMKVAKIQYDSFINIEFPHAASADSNARKSNPYETFTPGGIAARA